MKPTRTVSRRRDVRGHQLLTATAVAVGVFLGAPPGGVGARDRNCDDFRNQASAQEWLDSHAPGDPAGLDADGNGIACESLPCPCSTGEGPTPSGPRATARLIEVTDGDTLAVKFKGRREDVRLIGIDTPEIYGGEECGAAQASASMRRLVHPGDRVALVRDRSQANRDHYGRLLRYVERGGRDLGRRQIRKGLAKVYVVGTPFARTNIYNATSEKAEIGGRGVWSLCGGDFHDPL